MSCTTTLRLAVPACLLSCCKAYSRSAVTAEVAIDKADPSASAQDFGSRLRRRENASSSSLVVLAITLKDPPDFSWCCCTVQYGPSRVTPRPPSENRCCCFLHFIQTAGYVSGS